MTLTTTERITVDGVDLKTYAWNISTLGATLRRAGMRGANAPTAGRQGSLWTPFKPRDEAVYNWPMWIRGADQDGNIPGGSTSREEFFQRVDELIALFNRRDSLLDVRHILPDGSVRQTLLEVVDILNFATRGVNPLGRVDVQLTNPLGAAQDIADLDQAILTGSSLPTTLAFSTFAGATEMMDELIINIRAPWTNPRLEAYREGSPLSTPIWVQYNGALTGSQELVLNTITGEFSGLNGLTPSLSDIIWSGMPKYFAMVPRLVHTDPPQVNVSGSAATAATQVAIQGRRKYGTW